jgi:hypothetical protein
MVVGKHGIQLLKVVVVVPTSAHPLLFLDKWFVQIYLNVSYWNYVLDCSCLQDITAHHTTP